MLDWILEDKKEKRKKKKREKKIEPDGRTLNQQKRETKKRRKYLTSRRLGLHSGAAAEAAPS